MTGLPKPHIKVPLQRLAVLSDGSLELPSLLETDAKTGFARGRDMANEDFADNLAESRVADSVQSTFERQHNSLAQQRNEAGAASVEAFVENKIEDQERAVEEIKDEVSAESQKNVEAEHLVGHETEAEKSIRTDANDLKTVMGTLGTQTRTMVAAQTDLKGKSQGTAETTTQLKDSDRTEETGMTTMEGEIDLIKQQIASVQDVCSHKLGDLSSGMEKLHASGFSMTDALNKNGNFMKDLVHTLSTIDNQAVREVDATVELLRQIHQVDAAKERAAEEAKDAKQTAAKEE